MSDVPTLRAELDRKVSNTLDWLFGSYHRGKLDQCQFSTGIDTLFMAVSGIADQDFINIVTGAQEELSAEEVRPTVKRIFHHSEKAETISITWLVGDCAIVTTNRVCGEATGGKVKTMKTPEEARDFVGKFADLMKSKDWIEL